MRTVARRPIRSATVARRPIRLGLSALGAVALAVILSTVFGAAPASAAPPSGAGWSASWRYYLANTFELDADLPGVRLDAYASDNGGTGVVAGEIRDTAADGRCGLVRIFDNTGLIVEKGACGDGVIGTLPNVTYQGNLSVQLLRKVYDTGQFDMVTSMTKPTSSGDPTMRGVGVGTRWKYTSATAFQYEIVRPGVKVSGTGSNTSGDARTIGGKVERTTTTGCAQGTIVGSGTSPTNVCFPTVSTNMSTVTIGGTLTVNGCSTVSGSSKCLSVAISRPQ